jgi:hypothetical protein
MLPRAATKGQSFGKAGIPGHDFGCFSLPCTVQYAGENDGSLTG